MSAKGFKASVSKRKNMSSGFEPFHSETEISTFSPLPSEAFSRNLKEYGNLTCKPTYMRKFYFSNIVRGTIAF